MLWRLYFALCGDSEIKNNYKTIQDYKKLNKNIDVTYLSNCKLYPQLEIPEKIYRVI